MWLDLNLYVTMHWISICHVARFELLCNYALDLHSSDMTSCTLYFHCSKMTVLTGKVVHTLNLLIQFSSLTKKGKSPYVYQLLNMLPLSCLHFFFAVL